MLENTLKDIYIISITRQTLPGCPESIFDCDEEVLTGAKLRERIQWLKDGIGDSSIFNEAEVMEHYEDLMMDEHFDEDDYEYVQPTLEELLNLVDKGDMNAIESFINGDVNRIAEYSICSIYDWIC